MSKSYQFKIGDWVEFTTFIKVASSDGKRKAHEVGMIKSKVGQICGAVIRHLGDIKESSFSKEEGGRNYLIIRKAIILYQIKQGMINKSFECRAEDLNKIETDLKLRLPWKKIQLTNLEREERSLAAKTQPRDSKGKFVRYQLQAVNA